MDDFLAPCLMLCLSRLWLQDAGLGESRCGGYWMYLHLSVPSLPRLQAGPHRLVSHHVLTLPSSLVLIRDEMLPTRLSSSSP